jgi:hypothetical protein
LISIGQSPKKTIKKLGNNPIFFIDSVNVDNSELQKYDPTEIAQVTVYKDKEATDLLGEDGKDGVVYIFTKNIQRLSTGYIFSLNLMTTKNLFQLPKAILRFNTY